MLFDALTEQLAQLIVLPASGTLAGILNAVVGGAGIITIPAMLWAGLLPNIAVASNTAALVPSNFVTVHALRAELPETNFPMFLVSATSLIASIAGAALLLSTPPSVYAKLTPLLLGSATVLFAFGHQLNSRIKAFENTRTGQRLDYSALTLLIPAGLYQGYFGVGAGIIFLAALSIILGGNYKVAAVLRNLLNGLNGLAISIYCAVLGAIEWKVTVLVAVGTVLGGYIGARLIQSVPKEAMRICVIFTGGGLSIMYAARFWWH